VPTQASILSYSRASSTPPAIQTEKEYEKAAQIKSDDFGENERDALQAVREHLLPLRRRTSGSGCARHLAGPEVECSEVASSVFNIG